MLSFFDNISTIRLVVLEGSIYPVGVGVSSASSSDVRKRTIKTSIAAVVTPSPKRRLSSMNNNRIFLMPAQRFLLRLKTALRYSARIDISSSDCRPASLHQPPACRCCGCRGLLYSSGKIRSVIPQQTPADAHSRRYEVPQIPLSEDDGVAVEL